jgi:peptidoglycan/xylan/chitin deacetylase (PgdA/CDA1 family)
MMLSRREFLKLGATTALSLSGAGRLFAASAPGVPVLLYHDVSDQFDDAYTIAPAVFSAQMEWLYENGYRAVSLQEAAGLGPPGDGRAAVITFDDGYASYMDYAFPLFERYGFKSTINIIGSRVGKFIHYGGNRPTLSWDEYRFLAGSGLVDLGCHTLNLHLSGGVARFPVETLLRDLGAFNKVISKEIGRPTDIVAWPYGIYGRDSVRAAREAGYRYMLTSNEGYLRPGEFDEVPRLNISGRLDLVSFQQYIGGQ